VIRNGAAKMQRKEGLVAGAALALVLYTLSLGLLGPIVSAALRNQTISNTGSIEAIGVGIYWDQSCTDTVTSINWGILEPDSNVTRTLYIRNEGNTESTLSMATSNWNPSNASNYMTLSWDYEGQTLNANEVIEVKLTLSISASIVGITSFSFDITIAAHG